MNTLEIFKNLSNKWSFSRRIDKGEEKLHAKGTCEFQKIADNTILYQEECSLFLEDSTLKMTREYFYIYNPNVQSIEVYFTENNKPTKLFHALNNAYEGEHLCAQDIYKALYIFPSSENPDQLQIKYKILGPNKNFLIHTNYKKN